MISIITPVYNAAEYIEDTIKCVQAQTYTDYELILVDDASTDNGPDIIRRYLDDPRIKLVPAGKNGGAARARNIGLSEAKGRYIAFLDADDKWLPEKLSKEKAFMDEKGVGFVFTAYEFGDEKARPTGKIVHVPEELTYKKALTRTVIFTTTTLFDTEIIDKKLIEMPLCKSEDTATWWQILRNGHKAYGLAEVTAIYRRPAKSLSSNKFEAMKRIYYLYRKREGLGPFKSMFCFVLWAFRATLRRI